MTESTLVPISNASAYVSFLCINTMESGGCAWLKRERRSRTYTLLPSRCLRIVIAWNKGEKSKSHKKKEKGLRQNNVRMLAIFLRLTTAGAFSGVSQTSEIWPGRHQLTTRTSSGKQRLITSLYRECLDSWLSTSLAPRTLAASLY